MSNAKVSLVIRAKWPDGSRRYCQPVFTANGKLKPLYAEVNGKTEHHPKGVYALRYRNQGRLVYESLGSDSAEVIMAQRKEAYLQAVTAGLNLAETLPPHLGNQSKPPLTRTSLKETVAHYVDDVRHQKSRKNHLAYALTLKLFTKSCSKQYLQEIERKDVIAYMIPICNQTIRNVWG